VEMTERVLLNDFISHPHIRNLKKMTLFIEENWCSDAVLKEVVGEFQLQTLNLSGPLLTLNLGRFLAKNAPFLTLIVCTSFEFLSGRELFEALTISCSSVVVQEMEIEVYTEVDMEAQGFELEV
jgi:hypothetical protein